MNEKTKTSIMFAVVLVTGIALITTYGLHSDSVLAKTSSSQKSKSSSSGSSTSSSSSTSSGKLKNLVSCETTSAKAATGGLSQNQVMNCFAQAYGNATKTTNSTASTLH